MSDVSPINGIASPALAPLSRPSSNEPAPSLGPIRSGDKVELSRAAQFISKLISKNEVREDLVDRVKQELAAGTYETPDKIDAALDELLSEL